MHISSRKLNIIVGVVTAIVVLAGFQNCSQQLSPTDIPQSTLDTGQGSGFDGVTGGSAIPDVSK